MPAPNRYPDSLRRRAIDEVVAKGRAISAVSAELGMNDQTLRNWVNQERRDKGLAPGPTSEQLARIKELEKEVAELRRSNEILKEATRSPSRNSQHVSGERGQAQEELRPGGSREAQGDFLRGS